MVINDKLKGEYYRTPITKLASRNNVLTTLNELVDYFNQIYELLDKNFNNITTTRKLMNEKLLIIFEKTKHFQYVLDHFKIDVDSHIIEKLNDAINNFQNRMTTFVTPYDLNLFNHSSITDEIISASSDANSVEDWDRSVNMLSSNLGVRWFGGKITDRSLINNLNNILRITKVNTYEGFKNEDYINSNLILEIFLYTPKGMTWLSLGKNGDFGYNIITKYNSEGNLFNLKLLSENYNVRQSFDLNTFDFDMILNTLIDRTYIDNGNIYIKVKTNIPSNTESGKEGYFLSGSDKFNDAEIKKGISEFSRGLMYHDNKDVAYHEHKNDNIFDVHNKNSDKIETDNILNAKTENLRDFETDTTEKSYYADISNTTENAYTQTVYNPNMDKMVDLMDIVSGYFIANSSTKNTKNFYDNLKFNKKYEEGDKINYTKGENLVDISDDTFVGDLSLIPKNENMFAIENPFSKSKVLPSNMKYGSELENKIIENSFSNNESFMNISNNQYNQEADILLTPVVERNSVVYKVLKVTNEDVLILKSDGLYRFNSNKTIVDSNTFTQKINTNGFFNVCYDALVSQNFVYLATDIGICKMSTTTFVVEKTGVIGGSWCKLFETIDKQHIIGIRKDFSTSVENGKISYGNSVAITNNGTFNLINVAISDDSYYTYENPILDDELTDMTNALDYNDKRAFQTEFTVIPSEVENKYYFFRYGHKMLVTDAVNDSLLKFKNFKVVDALKTYRIANAIMFNNKLYFTVLNGGNYVYDLVTGTVSDVQYTTTKIVNNRNTVIKHYYMSKLSNLVGDNADSTGLVERYVKLSEEELAAGYVPGTKYYYPSIKSIHLVSIDERLNGPDPNIEYYGCIGNQMSVVGSWYIGKVEEFNNVTPDGTVNPDMNYGYLEFEDDGTYLDYTLAVSIEGFKMDHSKIYKKVQVEEVLPKENCFMKVANGKLFFIPNDIENEIRDVVYINGYYYFATNQDYIFKLDDNFRTINTIRSEDCNELFGENSLLVIQNNKIISEQVTKSEVYYDKVDGSEMIRGYNRDVDYYIEKMTNIENFIPLNINELSGRHDEYIKLDDETYTNDPDLAYDRGFTTISNDTAYDPNETYYVHENDEYRLAFVPGDFIVGDANSLSFKPDIEYAIKNEDLVYKIDTRYYRKNVTLENRMTKAEITNDNFIINEVYNVVPENEKIDEPDPNIDYYVSDDLPDIVHYDHINPEAKKIGYDSTTFNIEEYFIGDLVAFNPNGDDVDGKPLYVINDEGTNYIFVDYYRNGVTVLDPDTEYYTESGGYINTDPSDFNYGPQYSIVDQTLTPVPEQGVNYFIKLDSPDPDTGLLYIDAGIGGETIVAWDPTKTYYVSDKLFYYFKNDNEIGEQKTYFHKRLEDAGKEYHKAVKGNIINNKPDFKEVSAYDKLSDDDISAGPNKNTKYYTNDSVTYIELKEVLDKSNGPTLEKLEELESFGGGYLTISGDDKHLLYSGLTNDELLAGPVQGKVYYQLIGGVYSPVTYETLPNNKFDDKVKYFLLRVEPRSELFDEHDIRIEMCDMDSFDTQYKPINKETYDSPITKESISKIYVNPLSSEKKPNYEKAEFEFSGYDENYLFDNLDQNITLHTIYNMEHDMTLRDLYVLEDDTYREVTIDDFIEADRGYEETVRHPTSDDTYDENKTYYVFDSGGYREAIDSDFNMDSGSRAFIEGTTYYEYEDIYTPCIKRNPDITYYYRDGTIPLPKYRLSTQDDFDYTGDFENASFKEDRNYWLYRDDLPELSFKPDVTYYVIESADQIYQLKLKDKYVEANINNFESIYEKTDGTDTNVIKAVDIYDKNEKLYCYEPSSKTVTIISNINDISKTSFSLQDDINPTELLQTNGKLFVFDNGIVYDWLQDNDKTWKPISLNIGSSGESEAKLIGDNLIIINHASSNSDLWSVYYYDYSTRSLVESSLKNLTDKPMIVDNMDGHIVDKENGGYICKNNEIVVCDTNSSYIFNKKFVKIDNTLNQFETTNKYSGFYNEDSDSIEDLETTDFVTIGGSCLKQIVLDGDRTKYIITINSSSVISLYTIKHNDNVIRVANSAQGYISSKCESIVLIKDIIDDFIVFTEIGTLENDVFLKICGFNETSNSLKYFEYELDNNYKYNTIKDLKYNPASREISYVIDRVLTDTGKHELDFIHFPINGFTDMWLLIQDCYYNLTTDEIPDPNKTYYAYDGTDLIKIGDLNNSEYISYDEDTGEYRFIFMGVKFYEYNDIFNYNSSNSMDITPNNEEYNGNISYNIGFDTVVAYSCFYDGISTYTKVLVYKESKDDRIILNKELIYGEMDGNFVNNDEENLYGDFTSNRTETDARFLKIIDLNTLNDEDIIVKDGTHFDTRISIYKLNDDYIYEGIDDIQYNLLAFDENTDYFTLRKYYTFAGRDYYYKTYNIKFKLDTTYYTQKNRITVLDVITSARSYTSTDNTSKLYHRSLFKTKENSLKVITSMLNN